jgi:predicted DNA-binding transcriptional regulator AlpA
LKKILTKRQSAERIGRSVRHLERLISEGEGPPLVRLGARAIGIDEDDLEAWIAARRVVPPGWQDKKARSMSSPDPAEANLPWPTSCGAAARDRDL